MLSQADVTLPYSIPESLLSTPIKLFMECVTCLPSVMDMLLRSPPLLSDVDMCKKWMLTGMGDTLKMPLWKELEDHPIDCFEDLLLLYDKLLAELFGMHNFTVIKRFQFSSVECSCNPIELRDCFPSIYLDVPTGFHQFYMSQLVNNYFSSPEKCAKGKTHSAKKELLSKSRVLFLILPTGIHTAILDAIDLTGHVVDQEQVTQLRHFGSIFTTQEGMRAIVKNQGSEWKPCWLSFQNETVEETKESSILYHKFCLSIYLSEGGFADAKKCEKKSCTFDIGVPPQKEAEIITCKKVESSFQHLSLDESGWKLEGEAYSFCNNV